MLKQKIKNHTQLISAVFFYLVRRQTPAALLAPRKNPGDALEAVSVKQMRLFRFRMINSFHYFALQRRGYKLPRRVKLTARASEEKTKRRYFFFRNRIHPRVYFSTRFFFFFYNDITRNYRRRTAVVWRVWRCAVQLEAAGSVPVAAATVRRVFEMQERLQ